MLLGASVRAAAGSALRAGMRPWCADLFADADLCRAAPAVRCPPGSYPRGLAGIADSAPPGPWLYTGALENSPDLVADIARRRTLWGNPPEVLKRVRSPFDVARALESAGLPFLPVFRSADELPVGVRFLRKPLAGAGGAGIDFAPAGGGPVPARQVYFQRFAEGRSVAAVFVGSAAGAALLGVTEQLVGQEWLGAGRFRYCGSVGPVWLGGEVQQTVTRIGEHLAGEFGLRGLFGIDFVIEDGVPYPTEVNPRYTASVEVIEHATGLRALGMHRGVFDGSPLPPNPPPRSGEGGEERRPNPPAPFPRREGGVFPPSALGGEGMGVRGISPNPPAPSPKREGGAIGSSSPLRGGGRGEGSPLAASPLRGGGRGEGSPSPPPRGGEAGGERFPLPLTPVIGKAILFAPAAFAFPAAGPWEEDLRAPPHPWRLPGYADIPRPGEPIDAGHPVLTLFARGRDAEECREVLRAKAAELTGRPRALIVSPRNP